MAVRGEQNGGRYKRYGKTTILFFVYVWFKNK